MTYRENICSQVADRCLRCPLSQSLTGKDCRELTEQEMREIVQEVRRNE